MALEVSCVPKGNGILLDDGMKGTEVRAPSNIQRICKFLFISGYLGAVDSKAPLHSVIVISIPRISGMTTTRKTRIL